MAKRIEPAVKDHLQWLGFLQPVGLVVSATALVRANAILNTNDRHNQFRLREVTGGLEIEPEQARLPDFEEFACGFLDWKLGAKFYFGTEDNPIPEELQIPVEAYNDTLQPDFAVMNKEPKEEQSKWQLLVSCVPEGKTFDKAYETGEGYEASPHSRLERMLRQTETPAGLLYGRNQIRLVSAPRGESSGWMDFKLPEMLTTAGRPIVAAFHLLLKQGTLLTGPEDQRLPALLSESRKYQNEVSERLAEQVLHGLYELVRGFQAAHDASKGELLRKPLDEDPETVYRALLTAILRVVFLLYAEERGMLPDDDTFQRFYSVSGLYERLRDDATLNPDTMDQRYGAWAQLLSLFRIVYDGLDTGTAKIPPRHGYLFDPERFPFLEGRDRPLEAGQGMIAPLVPDGTIYRLLEKLLVLDGERISYRALDVEQIGSVYETMMGFRIETATGSSVAIKSPERNGAPTTVDLEQLLAEPAAKRGKWMQDHADRKLTDKVKAAVKEAESLEDLHAALDPVIDTPATPDLVPKGAMVLQPGEERRKSGSHYTPRELTEPIVRTTLRPVLQALQSPDGKPPRPEQILELKICDAAVGSGAFLVETCRQLGDALVESWRAYDAMPPLPSDEDEVLLARRTVAQKCLYGVDRNPVAADLAKVSLWLATLARDHAFTFLDHAIRVGDSLVGLTKEQLLCLDWEVRPQPELADPTLPDRFKQAAETRTLIADAAEEVPHDELQETLLSVNAVTGDLRLVSDALVAAFFSAEKAKQRRTERDDVVHLTRELLQAQEGREELEEIADRLRAGPNAVPPFHWPLEFPEVFERPNPGFDAFIGNPPFSGKNGIINGNPPYYLDWLKETHEGAHGNSDLVAHFFRRAFNRLRSDGTLGLIATNTIGQGDTRNTGLRYLCENGGTIYEARKRVPWPGKAAVIVSVVHVKNGEYEGPRMLEGKERDEITAFLFHRGEHGDPARLAANAKQSFVGSYVLGMGFTFDDTDTKGVANSIADARRLMNENPDNIEAIFPYIGGEEVNTHPEQKPHRFVINFFDMELEEVAERYPELLDIVRERVKPERESQKDKGAKEYWWRFIRPRYELNEAIEGLDRVLAISRVGQHAAFTRLYSGMVYSDSLIVFPFSTYAAFGSLQSRPHEVWTRFFGSSMKDDLRYTPSDCFETFPFPPNWHNDPDLEAAGEAYYTFRAELMKQHQEGLTKTYNRFHDPSERSNEIKHLRDLHAAMDATVLHAYGWQDLDTTCDFRLDYEVPEDDGRRKKPYRYRWSDETQEEILARLLELNSARAAEEAKRGKSKRK